MLLNCLNKFRHWLTTSDTLAQTSPKRQLRNGLSLETLESRIVLSGNWFTQNMPDTALQTLAQADYTRDGSITYSDMLGILKKAETQGTVSSSELKSLQALVSNASGLNMSGYVSYLASQTIDGNPSNNSYQYLNSSGKEVTQSLSNLAVGSSSTTLTDLTNKWFLGYNEPVSSTSYSAVSGSLFGSNGPVFTDVEQGDDGDCWLLASLAETADRDPSLIKNMFTSDGTEVVNGKTVGVWTAEFYNNGSPVYVTVNGELPSGGGYYDHPANGVLWVALAEKAYAEANGMGAVTTSYENSNSYSALNGGWPNWALSAITGQNAGTYSLNTNTVAQGYEVGSLVVLCTGSTPASSYIVPDHCYALINYNSSSSQPYEVYNPWGTNSSGWALGTYNGQAVYGLFTANAAFISANFAEMSYLISSANTSSQSSFSILPESTMNSGEQTPSSTESSAVSSEGTALDNLAIQQVQDLMSSESYFGDITQGSLVGDVAVFAA